MNLFAAVFVPGLEDPFGLIDPPDLLSLMRKALEDLRDKGWVDLSKNLSGPGVPPEALESAHQYYLKSANEAIDEIMSSPAVVNLAGFGQQGVNDWTGAFNSQPGLARDSELALGGAFYLAYTTWSY